MQNALKAEIAIETALKGVAVNPLKTGPIYKLMDGRFHLVASFEGKTAKVWGRIVAVHFDTDEADGGGKFWLEVSARRIFGCKVIKIRPVAKTEPDNPSGWCLVLEDIMEVVIVPLQLFEILQ
ncbi:MAG: hypothetical protein AAB871_01505 [Patescibacteria group bacterium]